MKAVCWMGKHNMRAERVADPTIINPHDAIIKISATAIRSSDLHLYDGFIPSMMPGDITGHEFMGEVMETGPEVQKLKMGRTHVQSYLEPLLKRVEGGEVDPAFMITHRMSLDEATEGYRVFHEKENDCIKIVPWP